MFGKEKMNEKAILMQVIENISALDTKYPGLGMPKVVRQLKADGYFNIEERPWDFLVMLGYSMSRLLTEVLTAGGSRDLEESRSMVKKVLRRPPDWVCAAFTPEVQARYSGLADGDLPEVEAVFHYVPKRSDGEPKLSWQSYARLLYVLREFCYGTYITDREDGWMLDIPSIWDVLNLVLSMENPPSYVVDSLKQEIATHELHELHNSLKDVKRHAIRLSDLGYTSPSCSTEIRNINGILRVLGHDVDLVGESKTPESETEPKKD